MLATDAGLAADRGVEPVTIEPSGDMDPDIVAMRRVVRAMVGAVVNERPTVANWLRV